MIAPRVSRELTEQLVCEENQAKHVRMAEVSSPILSLPCVMQPFESCPRPPDRVQKGPLLKPPGWHLFLKALREVSCQFRIQKF